MQTFLDYLHESLLDLSKGKGEPARATYPKTVFKRFADEHNHKMRAWHKHNAQQGHTFAKRSGTGDTYIIDCFDGDQLISTAVIEHFGEKDYTFSFYNHADDIGNKLYKPHASHEGPWEFTPISIDDTHHSDTRNIFTTPNPSKSAKTHRTNDGGTLASVISSTRAR